MLARIFSITAVLLFVASIASGQEFRVQITARAEPVPADYFKQKGVEKYITSTDQLGLYRYFAGAYKTRDEAEKVKKSMIEKGFPYAYVIDLEEQRILCGAGCPYFRNGMVYVQDTSQMRRTIYFDFGRYSLTPDSKAKLLEVLEIMRSNPKYRLKLLGHTDAIGSAKANAVLAANRARSARNYLIAKNLRADRMYVQVVGEAEPIGDNQTIDGEDLPENRRFNRRVVLTVFDESGEIK
jgi:outer membrane protein OmpA-like peptidoglycan-associated protein